MSDARFRLTWRGKVVKATIDEATRKGIDATTAAAVTPAMQRVPVRTGTLRRGIAFRPAVLRARKWVGQFGVFLVNYALWVEIGTRKMRARPYLRPAAAQEFPKLVDNIKRFLR